MQILRRSSGARPTRRTLGSALLLVAGLGIPASLGGWAFVYEPASLVVREHRVALPDWPAPMNGLRIAVLADIHTGSPFNGLGKLRRIVAETQSAAPDLILIAGDLVIHGVVGGSFVGPEECAEVLAELHAPLGVYAVLGNHDWWLDAPRVSAALTRVGISLLEDRSVRIERGAVAFWLIGVSDWWEGAHDVDAALSQTRGGAADPAPRILFTHNPDVFPLIPPEVDLTIAGHTHGGQVWLPLLGRPVVPSEYGERFAIGHVVEGGRHLFVSPGLGTSILPVRFRVPPEVTLLELVAGAPLRSL